LRFFLACADSGTENSSGSKNKNLEGINSAMISSLLKGNDYADFGGAAEARKESKRIKEE
jgi:hypothetical protein